MGLANKHILIVGASGYGKSTAEISQLVEEADRGNSAIIVLDPHVNSTAQGVLTHCVSKGLTHRMLYENLGDLTSVLRWDFLTPSYAKEPLLRQQQDDASCRSFAELLLRRRGKAGMADTPGTEEWLMAALRLYISQPARRPLTDLKYIYRFSHPASEAMLDVARDHDTVDKIRQIANDGQTPYKAAERLIAGTCDSPAFQARVNHGGGFDYGKFLDKKGILIIEGGGGDDGMRTMMGAILMKTLGYLRSRKREHPTVTVCLDEANNAGLVGAAGHEVKALAELRKYGLAMHILVQVLDFPSESITTGVITNCATKMYFHSADSSVAKKLGEDLGGSYMTDDYDRRYYKDGSTWDAPVEKEHFYSDEIRELDIGECYYRRGTVNSLERIKQLEDPYGNAAVTRFKISEAIARMQSKTEYHTPDGMSFRKASTVDPDDNAPEKIDPDEDNPFGI